MALVPFLPNQSPPIFPSQIHDYSRLILEIARLLRPGGLVLLIEPDFVPIVDGKPAIGLPNTGLHGWLTLWETYRACLKRQGIDATVPQRLAELLAATEAFENIVAQSSEIPVGVWPSDLNLLTMGQLQWMDYELLFPALKPLLLSAGVSEAKVERIIADAQHDLYHPSISISTHLHIVYASKCL